MTKINDCYLTYSWYGGGGFDGFDSFGPVFLNEDDAKKWVEKQEKECPRYHHSFERLELIE